jgi:hypothetical protein
MNSQQQGGAHFLFLFIIARESLLVLAGASNVVSCRCMCWCLLRRWLLYQEAEDHSSITAVLVDK